MSCGLDSCVCTARPGRCMCLCGACTERCRGASIPVERSAASVAEDIASRMRALGIKAEVTEDSASGAEVAICIGGQHPSKGVPKAMRIWFEFCHAVDLDLDDAQRLLARLNESGVVAEDASRLLAEVMPWSKMANRLRKPMNCL
jgi:hypothetical protein